MQMNKNPFVLPGFGQGGQLGQNPILASMEMMRQAWEGLARAGAMEPGALSPVMSVEELDKRIADLRAVENWLRMNLSMLSSTIQGLEVQRATMATIQSFVDTGMATMKQATASVPTGVEGAASQAGRAAAGGTDEPSPLEKVLALWSAASQPGRSDPEHSREAGGPASRAAAEPPVARAE